MYGLVGAPIDNNVTPPFLLLSILFDSTCAVFTDASPAVLPFSQNYTLTPAFEQKQCHHTHNNNTSSTITSNVIDLSFDGTIHPTEPRSRLFVIDQSILLVLSGIKISRSRPLM